MADLPDPKFQAERNYQYQLDCNLAKYRLQLDFSRVEHAEIFTSVLTYGQSALKAAILLNGAGAIALLAFFGHLLTAESSYSALARDSAPALFWYATGAAVAALAVGAGYIAQALFAKDMWHAHGADDRGPADGPGDWGRRRERQAGMTALRHLRRLLLRLAACCCGWPPACCGTPSGADPRNPGLHLPRSGGAFSLRMAEWRDTRDASDPCYTSHMRPLLAFLAVLIALPVHAEIAGRATVMDADTIEIHGERIRLDGIDAPESGQTCRRPSGEVWRCGQAATLALADRIGSQTIRCEARDIGRYLCIESQA